MLKCQQMAQPETQTSSPLPRSHRGVLRWLGLGEHRSKQREQEVAPPIHQFVVGTERRDQRQAFMTPLPPGTRLFPKQMLEVGVGCRRIVSDVDPQNTVRHRILYNDPKYGLRGIIVTKSRQPEPTKSRENQGWSVAYVPPVELFAELRQRSDWITIRATAEMIDIGPKIDIGMPDPDLRDPYTRRYNQVLAAVEDQDKNLAKHAHQARIKEAAILAAQAALGV